mgnify:FL=1
MQANITKWLSLIIGLIAIVAVSIVVMIQINVNHQTNSTRSKECIQNGCIVVIEAKGFTGLASVVCEQ